MLLDIDLHYFPGCRSGSAEDNSHIIPGVELTLQVLTKEVQSGSLCWLLLKGRHPP